MSGPRTVLMVLALTLATLVMAGEEVESRDGEEAQAIQATGRNIRVTKFYQVPSQVKCPCFSTKASVR